MRLRLRWAHVFRGERLGGRLRGYHHEGRRPRHPLTPGTIGATKPSGPYEARWTGFGVVPTAAWQGKYSTFFPRAWSRQKVEEAIRRVAGSALLRNTLTPGYRGSWLFRGRVFGVMVRGALSPSKKTIMTSFPEYK